MDSQSDDMLLPNGALRLLPSSFYRDCDQAGLRLWCHHNARYGLPTVELVEWLKEFIGGRETIEIGAGSGDLCHHLGIPGFDNYQQELPDVREYYAALRQPTIRYAPWVAKMDALDAVRKLQPSVVIGSWITQWIDPNKPAPPGGGNMYGVKEDELIKLVDHYVLIGNLGIHRGKPIFKLPHETLRFDFVHSRAALSALDRIFIWKRQ